MGRSRTMSHKERVNRYFEYAEKGPYGYVVSGNRAEFRDGFLVRTKEQAQKEMDRQMRRGCSESGYRPIMSLEVAKQLRKSKYYR